MFSRQKQLHTTDVDGVPTFFVDTGMTPRATLYFRYGQADESLASRGHLHLAEHMLMHGFDHRAVPSNAGVGPLLTEFSVIGDQEELKEFFSTLCRRISDPPLDALEHEREILKAEADRRELGTFTLHAAYRFGAQGLGLLAYDELGLAGASEERIRELISTAFRAGNAALTLNCPPPSGLRLLLPDGGPPPTPHLRPLEPGPPYHALSWEGVSAASGLASDWLEPTVAAQVLEQRISTRLRDERGHSYSTTSTIERVDATQYVVVVESDVQPDSEAQAVQVMYDEFRTLADQGVAPDELDLVRRRRLRELHDEITGEWQAMSAARLALWGQPPLLEDDLRTTLESLTPGSLKPTFTCLADTFIATSGAGDGALTELRFESGFPEVPAPSGGRTYEHARAPLDSSRLVVSPEILEVALGSTGDVRRLDLRECAAMRKFADGGRILWSYHGDAIPVEPALWRDGMAAVRMLDTTVDPSVQLPEQVRPVEERPRTPRLGMIDRLSIFADKPAGAAVIRGLGFIGLALVIGLVFGSANAPGGGHLDRLLIVAVVTALGTTWLYRRKPHKRLGKSVRTEAPPPTSAETSGPSRREGAALLLTRSCTTGWLDWVHGELWLTPDALVRRRLGWASSMGHGTGRTVRIPERVDAALPELDPPVVRAGHRTNKHLAFDEVESAHLTRGPMSGCLKLRMRDGSRHKLLFLLTDPAYRILQRELPTILGERLEAK